MESSHFAAVLRTLLPPGLEKIKQSTLEQAQTDKVDFLFLYRSDKKRRYFSRVAREALGDYRCLIASYHQLPRASGRPLAPECLKSLLNQAERELFNARGGHRMMHLRPLVMWLRERQIRKIYSRLDALLEETHPSAIVVWNGNKFQDCVLHAANTRGVPVIYFENGVLPASTTVDLRGINADNSVPRDPNVYRSMSPENVVIQKPGDRKPRKRLFKRKEPDVSPKDVGKGLNILLPFQKERDTQILNHSPWIHSMPEFYRAVHQAVHGAGLEEHHLWLREHPSAASDHLMIHREVAAASDCSFANGGRLADWLEKMDLVITINSSVGMEALLMGKKVITLGKAFYNIPGLVEHADSPEALTEAIHRSLATPVDERLRQGFFAYLAQYYVVAGDWCQPDLPHWRALRSRMVPALTLSPQRRLATSPSFTGSQVG